MLRFDGIDMRYALEQCVLHDFLRIRRVCTDPHQIVFNDFASMKQLSYQLVIDYDPLLSILITI